jgi:hypothetical protein
MGDEVYVYNEVTGEVGEYKVTHVHTHDKPVIADEVVRITAEGEIT